MAFIDILCKIFKPCSFADFLLIDSYVQGGLQNEQGAAFQGNYFGKVLLINFISTWNNLPKHCIFAGSLFIIS